MCFRNLTDERPETGYRKTGAEEGFTLLETLVSAAILVIVIIAVYEAFVSGVSSIRAAQQAEQVNQTARIVFERISLDLVSAVTSTLKENRSLQLGMVSRNRTEDGQALDDLDFTSFSHMVPGGAEPETDLCEIGYSLEKDPGAKGFVLYRRDTAPPDNDLSEGGVKLQLARNVGSLNFRFEDQAGRTLDSLNTLEGEEKDRLPLLITVELTVLDKEGKEHLFVTSVHPALSGKGNNP